MDRPNRIFDHADLGTREPNDPELGGRDPGHPWYYLMGGRPLRPEEIEPHREWELPHDTKLDSLKDSSKRKKRLVEMRAEHEKHVQYDIERYLEVVTPGYKVSSCDRMNGYGLETSICLCHNHILANKMWLAAINRELAKTNPLLGTDYQVEPCEVPQPSVITVREAYKPAPQVKEQLRLF